MGSHNSYGTDHLSTLLWVRSQGGKRMTVINIQGTSDAHPPTIGVAFGNLQKGAEGARAGPCTAFLGLSPQNDSLLFVLDGFS
jgi:hypothetical protein